MLFYSIELLHIHITCLRVYYCLHIPSSLAQDARLCHGRGKDHRILLDNREFEWKTWISWVWGFEVVHAKGSFEVALPPNASSGTMAKVTRTMQASGDRRAGAQSRRGSPAQQTGPATQATRVRPSYRRLAGAIPLVVRDTPHGWAAPRAAAQRRGHVALLMDTWGDTLPPGTPGPVGRDTAFPSTCGSGLRGT